MFGYSSFKHVFSVLSSKVAVPASDFDDNWKNIFLYPSLIQLLFFSNLTISPHLLINGLLFGDIKVFQLYSYL